MDFDREKFKRLVHYVIWKAGKRDWFGATKLNKVLWFAESRVYVLTGKGITGATYVREKHGPVPRAMMPIRAELEREGTVENGMGGQAGAGHCYVGTGPIRLHGRRTQSGGLVD